MNPVESWREPLEPPAGGLARLVRGVQARRTGARRPRLRRLAIGAGAAILVLALGLAHHRREARHHAFERQWRSALDAERREHGIARELPSERTDVRIVVLSPAPAGAGP